MSEAWRDRYDDWKLSNREDEAALEEEREARREAREEIRERQADEDAWEDKESWSAKCVVMLLYGLVVWLLMELAWERQAADAVALGCVLVALWIAASPPRCDSDV